MLFLVRDADCLEIPTVQSVKGHPAGPVDPYFVGGRQYH